LRNAHPLFAAPSPEKLVTGKGTVLSDHQGRVRISLGGLGRL
jgi:hypothetical protein